MFHICGGTRAFRTFMELVAAKNEGVAFYTKPSELPHSSGPDQVYLMLPNYEQGDKVIPEQSLKWLEAMLTLRRSGSRFYIENYMAQDYLHGSFTSVRPMGRERYFYQEYIEWEGRPLQSRDGFYLPTAMRFPKNEMAAVSDCIGTNNIFRKGNYHYPVLLKALDANVLSALTDLSAFNPLFRKPYRLWMSLWKSILHELANIPGAVVEEAFLNAFPPIEQLSNGNTSEQAVEKALNWHLKSGLFISEDGSKGMFEMIRSNDLGIRANLRTDATLLTGALFASAGQVRQQEKLTRIGCNLADFILNRGGQRPDGFFKWFDHTNTIWASDSGRDGLAIWQLFKCTGLERYRKSAMNLANAMLRWLAKDGLCCGSFRGDAMPTDAMSINNPVYYGEMVAFLLQLHNDECTSAALKIIERIAETFPQVSPFGFSDNFTWCRWLLMLSSAQFHTKEDFSQKINQVLDFFEALQEDCGGIRETAIRLEGQSVEAGIAVGDGSDSIADLLYCNNYVLCSLSILLRLNKERQSLIQMPKVKAMYKKLRDFTLNIQISSTDARLDGGWMRAFDMRLNEYHGLNKDMDWGSYCIMAGWVMGLIPLVLLYEGQQSSLFTE